MDSKLWIMESCWDQCEASVGVWADFPIKVEQSPFHGGCACIAERGFDPRTVGL